VLARLVTLEETPANFRAESLIYLCSAKLLLTESDKNYRKLDHQFMVDTTFLKKGHNYKDALLERKINLILLR
jgi:hypothetical protein